MDLANEAKAVVGAIPMTEIFKRTLKEFVRARKKEPKKINVQSKTSTKPQAAKFQS